MNVATAVLSILLVLQQSYAPADFNRVSGQTLQTRWDNAIAQGRRGAADSFWIAWSFPVRSDLRVTGMDGNLSVSSYGTADGFEWIPDHTERQNLGVFLMIRKSDGGIDKTRLVDLDQNFRVHDRQVYWLGTPDSNESVALLASLAGSAAQSAGSSLLHAMTLHDGGSATPRLLELAKSPSNPLELRKNAMFWLGQEVSRQADAGLTGMLGDPNTEIQKQAVFAISRRNNEESIPALIDIAKNHPNPAVRKEAIVWLAQKRDDRVLAFFEQLLKK